MLGLILMRMTNVNWKVINKLSWVMLVNPPPEMMIIKSHSVTKVMGHHKGRADQAFMNDEVIIHCVNIQRASPTEQEIACNARSITNAGRQVTYRGD